MCRWTPHRFVIQHMHGDAVYISSRHWGGFETMSNDGRHRRPAEVMHMCSSNVRTIFVCARHGDGAAIENNAFGDGDNLSRERVKRELNDGLTKSFRNLRNLRDLFSHNVYECCRASGSSSTCVALRKRTTIL